MFGHLKAEDFISLIEASAASLKDSRLQAHLQSCARCTEAFISAQELHAGLRQSAMDEQDIPEPDWFQFRADVRNTMLSRAAQRQARQAKTNFWSGRSGWMLRPALTWGLLVAFAAGLSSGVLLWNRPAPVLNVDSQAVGDDEIALDAASFDSELSAGSQTAVFRELSLLTDAESEKLQRLLEADEQQVTAK